jgi:hypothetical protein
MDPTVRISMLIGILWSSFYELSCVCDQLHLNTTLAGVETAIYILTLFFSF